MSRTVRRTARAVAIAGLRSIGAAVAFTAPCAGQRATVQAAVVPPGEAQLDSMLAAGRKKPGLRTDSRMIRTWLDGVVGNPFIPMLRELGDLAAPTFEADSFAVVVARFKRFTDSTWTPLASYLAALADSYSLDTAWAHVLGAADSVSRRMLASGAEVSSLLTPGQRAEFPPSLRSFFYPTCAAWFHERLVNGLESVPSVSPSRINVLPVCPEAK